MRINTITSRETTVSEVADAVAASTPEEFASFFLRLSEHLLKDDEKMMGFAEEMAMELGANRKKLLRELLSRIAYFEGKQKWEPRSTREGSEE